MTEGRQNMEEAVPDGGEGRKEGRKEGRENKGERKNEKERKNDEGRNG